MTDQAIYTLGFIFDEALAQVLLIRKLRPAWQTGKLNGLGGTLEMGETPVEGILREVWEESALTVPADRWAHVADMQSDGWLVHVLAAIYDGPLTDARTQDEGQLAWVPVDALPATVISNLTWLVPLCLDRLRNGEPSHCTVVY